MRLLLEGLRLDESHNLLAQDLSLKDIANRTGYSTPAQLTKAFERRYGMTPVLFRKLHVRSGGE